MVRETRHLWVGNLPDNIREDRIREHFKRYGRVQSVKLLPRCTEEKTGEITMACTVAFMDIKSASKAHNAELKIDDRTLNTEYYEPAAIPSAASPQNTPSPYSTSPGSTRFPNGHGSSDEHGATFPERFYERSSSRGVGSVASEGDFIRRTASSASSGAAAGYHDATTRSRTRDRSYRNGPSSYTTSASIVDSSTTASSRHSSRTINNSWTYDSARYNNTTGCSQTDTGYSTTPSENSERRTSDQNSKKKTKSRSGSRSPSPSASASSRSPSRSRSRSSSSSSSSSTSRDTSSTSSPKSRRLASSSTTSSSNHQPVVHSDDRRPLAICVKNLPLRSSDTSLKDGLFHEYKKHGKVTWVKVVGQNSERHAIVCFKKPEDVEKALEVSYDKLFFGCKIEVAAYQGYDVEDNDLRPYEAEIDEFHPKATRTLFIGNLEKDVTASDLRKHFDQFGEIIEIDIKKQGAVSSYAFCQYSDIVSVVRAIRKMDGEHLGNNRIKLGFGKSMPYNCVWVDGVGESVNEKYLRMQFEPFGAITKVHIDREKGQALVFYDQVLNAQAAVNKMRGFSLKNTKIQVDFASRECQESFFERLEKQGAVLERDRSAFEERKETTTRSFESSYIARFSRYETPTRPRTSSYSSRSSTTGPQAASAMQSPGTPGSATPRGSRSSRVARFADYYEQATAVDYADRHFRSYDEYSQGSGASHEDEYVAAFGHDGSPTQHPADALQAVVEVSVPFAPPDIRNLQKERVHLLEQLEECPSSGDELISPKKRLKLDLMDATITSDVIIEANRDSRKVMEVVRRVTTDANAKHHSRRPSVDSGKHAAGRGEAGNGHGYLAHAACKRRKTTGVESRGTAAATTAAQQQQQQQHHYDHHSGSESAGGSRPGTPLVDERPENFQPSEPRRIPREREGPLTLPLPRFAAQVMNRGSVSVAGIKGQKDNATLSSPPPSSVTSPRISSSSSSGGQRPPSPVHHVPPPASPPPRPPSLSSNSSDSGAATPPSPSLEERIRSLDEKYEKWSGSRALSAAGGDALAALDANLEKFRMRHKLLDLDLKEVQPSEIVKSVMAKRSVFDEDLKRLENVGEKYEPKEFCLFPRAAATSPAAAAAAGTTTTATVAATAAQTSVPATPLSAPPALKLAPIAQSPKTPTMLSPRSAGTGVPTAKGLQYPFPTHPPLLMSPVPPPTTAATATTPTTTLAPPATPTTPTATTTTTTTRGAATHGDNSRLKSCAAADSRTSSKVNVNRSNSATSCSTVAGKTSEKTNATNIPNNSGGGDVGDSKQHAGKSPRSSDKTSDKVSYRRDSNSSSPRADAKTRRNSDTSARRIEDGDGDGDGKERAKSEERKKERLEKARIEHERLEKEKSERERVERERLEKEKQEKERLERERLEKERLERESELEKQRLEKERLEKERIEKERQERERAEKEKARQEKERAERARQEKEEHERLEKERKERERKEREERERRDKEEKERREREEQQERERLEKERKDRERKEREERERREREERERREREEREHKEREEKERREEESRLEKEKERLEKLERERKREEDRARHKDDNHDRRKDEHKHHGDAKHRENNLDKHLYEKIAKEGCKEEKSGHELLRRDSHHEKNRHHADRDSERRKDSIKENRDNNVHDKHKNDVKEVGGRTLESRHMSIELDKSKLYDGKQDANKRKERNNSLPANVGSKRRLSSHDSLDGADESKRIKSSHDHKKLTERRDSKDVARSEDRSKSRHKNNVVKSHDKHNSVKDFDEKRKEREKEREERHKKHKLEKQKSKSKSREKEPRESPGIPKSPLTDKDFLARLDLKSTDELDKHKDNKECKENKEKRKDSTASSTPDDKEPKEKPCFDAKKEKPCADKQNAEKALKGRLEIEMKSEERKKRERIRKITNSSESDSDEPKKHSIFDIVDDEPAYISMYDKVKARSCKNMAKQEEEKRQEKIKAKFSQLKQSRAKREEKKRSTSWDEDSDSDKDPSEMKTKRSKMLIDSSDDESQERKSRKKKDIHSDSDSSAVARQIKQEHLETSDDEIKNKSIIFKTCKSLISREIPEDDHGNKRKLQSKVKTEVMSDPEITSVQSFADLDEKPHLTKVKDELERLIKKERRNSKHHDSLAEINAAQPFTDLRSPLSEPKIEKFNSRHSFAENTTDDEGPEIKKERSERREKKHKKKQKKQKHSASDESCKLDNLDSTQSENAEKPKHHEKKKDHSKKEKRRDKTRDKSKKSKKNKSETKSEAKREGKMENIFGSLSEDSENGAKEREADQKPNLFHGKLTEDELQHSVYNSESEKEQDAKAKEKEEREREREEHKRRKEKKRREKERRQQEAAAAAAAAALDQASNENSMDYADMGKQLEENMMKDESLDVTEETTKSEIDSANLDNADDPFHFTDVGDLQDIKRDKEERKEPKEKKKKRKKSKDERGKHHHHHHHDKNKAKSPEFKEDVSPTAEIKIEIEESSKAQSLPTIVDEHGPPATKPATPDFSISPMTRDSTPIISPIPKTPTSSKEKKREKFIPGFGVDIDEKLHESAVKSISEFETAVKKEEVVAEDDAKSDKSQAAEEKPRVVISQEETEDAVAALLGESFGGGQFEECYSEEINSGADQTTSLAEETNVQDDEEMRQAVQSLSASDLDAKPDTPQSEHELQIDTDTEEQEEMSLRFEQKTPDIPDFSQPPKTSDIATYYRKNEEKTTIPSPFVLKAANISSPPSLTPIKPQPAAVAEIRKNLDLEQKSLPLLPEQQQRSVISQPWSKEKQQEVVPKAESPAVKTDPSMPSISESTSPQQSQCKTQTAPTLRQYATPSMVKISDPVPFPPLKAIVKPEHVKLTPVSDQLAKVPSVPHLQPTSKSPAPSQLHNLPARSPVQINKPTTPVHDSGLLSPKSSSGLIHNRLPITSVMVSKPLQATTVILQQSKMAHSMEPPKLVSTSDHRPQERPRTVFQTTSTIQQPQFPNFVPNQPRMVLQGGVRHIPPQGLLVPTKQLPPNNYGYVGNIPHSAYGISPIVKDNVPAIVTDKIEGDPSHRATHPIPPGLSLVSNQNVQPVIMSPSTQSHLPMQQPVSIPNDPKSSSPVSTSPNGVATSTPSPKPFVSSAISPKPSPVPVCSPSPLASVSSPKPVTPVAITKIATPTSSPSSVTIAASPVSSITEAPQPSTKTEQTPPSGGKPELARSDSTPELKPTNSFIIKIPSKDGIVDESKQVAKTDTKPSEPPAKLAIEKVTEELNMFLEKESPEVKEEVKPDKPTNTETDTSKPKPEEEVKKEPAPEKHLEAENVSVIKEIEKFDEEKADTESVVSDISKERSSADILAKDDPLDTKEDSDYWSAKEVNIDSVIKTLCSADELSDHSSENGKDEWFDDGKATKTEEAAAAAAKPDSVAMETSKSGESEIHDEGVDAEEEQKETLTLRSSTRNNRGGRNRGRGKSRGGSVERGGIQTRRGKLKETLAQAAGPPRRGRGGRPKTERKTNKSESEAAPADVYEFRDESDDANKEQRPRLILTIKSPAVSNASSAQTTAIVKEVTKDGTKELGKEQTKEPVAHAAVIKHAEAKDEFTSPTTTNTRKSRRLQEKDTSRNTVDDTIEDVVKNTIQTRAAASQRRSPRQATPKQPQQPPAPQETSRKSPRGRKPRRGSEATENSSSDDTPKEEVKPAPSPQKTPEPAKEAEKVTRVQAEPPKEKPHEGLKAAMLRRIKGELASSNHHEPTNLIDPVTGELIPMRESEEGKYIPLPGSAPDGQKPVVAATKAEPPAAKAQGAVAKSQPTVIAQTQQQPSIIQQPKPQSLKAHVLSSQAAQAVVTQQASTMQAKLTTLQQSSSQSQPIMTSKASSPVSISKSTAPIVASKGIGSVLTSKPSAPTLIGKTVTPIVVKPVTPMVVSKSISPISQHLNINTSLDTHIQVSTAHLSPRPTVPLTATSKALPKQLAKPRVMSPVALSHPKQILQTGKQQSPQLPKGHMVTSQAPIVNTQMAHMKQHQSIMKQQVIMAKGTITKPAHLHQQQILAAAAVPSPPLGKSQSPLGNPSRIIQGPATPTSKGVMEPPKVDVSMANVMLGQRPKLSPQGPQQRLVGQTGIPVPGYEASLGEAIAHFPPGPLRPPPDLNPAHYMHPSHVMQYQQYLRQQQLQHLTRSGAVEKVGDGQEGEEAPVTSPPLELRRPGSVGLTLTGRGVAVPHSLHSPHDRATDSPQVGQVYNVHSARMQHYRPSRYYDQTEPPLPPPAHCQQTSHSTLAALGSDRGLAHMTPLGTPDRPLSGHSALTAHMGGLATPPDRPPLSSHVDRPLSAHGLMGAGLGAAGNLMGAVARHIGVDAPASQRGLQAATPPHASQVPPQAESLFMLLKHYPCMWQGLLALKNDQAAVQMYLVSGNDDVAKCSLPKNTDGSTPPLRIFQRMRLEPPQVEGVARKMQMENEHCMLLALPCGHDHMDVLKQSTNLTTGFITYLQQKQAAGIVNVAAPGTTQPPAYVVHIFPSCDFVNENLRRIAPSLLERVADIAHLLIVITTV